ncbi:hypothetical protein [Lentilactobacillus parafarraginis]|nr:hypothetical protein [Lentilactobacillus parafarraginis]
MDFLDGDVSFVGVNILAVHTGNVDWGDSECLHGFNSLDVAVV